MTSTRVDIQVLRSLLYLYHQTKVSWSGLKISKDKLEWAELNQAEAVRLQMYAQLRFQVLIVTAQLNLNSSWDRQSNHLDHHPTTTTPPHLNF